jgi:hypothetical protein
MIYTECNKPVIKYIINNKINQHIKKNLKITSFCLELFKKIIIEKKNTIKETKYTNKQL